MEGGVEVTISREGAEALRSFGQAIPYAVDQITQDTDALRAAFNAVSGDLGELEKSFAELIETCVKAVKKAQESIEGLPADLEATAGAIDRYLNALPKIDVGSLGVPDA